MSSGQSAAAALVEHLERSLEWVLSYLERPLERKANETEELQTWEAFDVASWPPWILASAAESYATTYMDSVHVPLPTKKSFGRSDVEAPIVSWLMPVKDTPSAWLDLAFRSIEQQVGMAPGSWELIVVDDGSSEAETLTTLAVWDSNPSIRVLRSKGVGIAAALNEGWRQCRGRYVSRLDGDDYAHPTRLEKQISFLDRHPSISIVGGGFCTFEETSCLQQYRFPCHPVLARWHMIFSCSLAHPTVTFRRSSFGQGPYPEGKEAEDHWCWLSLPLDVHFANLADVACYIRRHPSSRSSKAAAALQRSSFDAVSAFLQRHGFADGLREEDVKVLWGKANAVSAEQADRVSKALDWLEKFFVSMIQSGGATDGVVYSPDFEEDFLGLRKTALEDYVARLSNSYWSLVTASSWD